MEGVIDSMLLKKKEEYKSYKLVFMIVKHNHQDVLELVESNTCPYCLRRFKKRSSLRRHIHRNLRCGLMHKSLIKEIIGEYTALRNVCVTYLSGHNKCLERKKLRDGLEELIKRVAR